MPLVDKIVRDPFTERLLAIMLELTKKGAIRFKKTYAEAIDIRLTTLYQIERQDRNYPLDDTKRSLAQLSLKEKFFVNPTYLTGGSNTMFFKEPLKVVVKTGEGHVTKVSSTREVAGYIEQINKFKGRIAELEAELARCEKQRISILKKNKSQPKLK